MGQFKGPRSNEALPDLDGLTVLVVEDAYLVALELAGLLEQAGCVVRGPCASVSEALGLLRRHGDELSGAILDVDLHGVKSTAIATALVERGIPFIVVTGYEADVLSPPLRQGDYIAKPMRVASLLETVARRFAPRRARASPRAIRGPDVPPSSGPPSSAAV